MKSESKQNGIEPARPDSAVSDGYEFWSIQGKPVSIHLRSSVAGQIRAMSDIQPVGGMPVENGGILWGRVRDVGEEYFIVSIEQADYLPCDHERGEAWVPSVQDRRELKKHLKQKNGDLRPVGFWRSHRRRGLYLDKRDLDLMQVFFPRPWSVALCVRLPATAGFFIWENGDIRRTGSYREFQLPDAGQLAAIPLRRSPTPWKKWAAIGSLAAAITITPFLLKSTDSSTPFNVLSMRAHTKPGIVRLSWDARSKLLRAANSAVVWIADGVDESKLELTADQLRAGSIEYKPTSPTVNFRMQVGQFMESLSVDAALPQGAPEPITVVAHAPSEPAPEPVVERQRSRRAPQKIARKVEVPSPVRSTFEPPPAPEVPAPPQISVPPKLDRPNLPERADAVPKVSATVEKPGSSPLKKVFGFGWIPGRKKDFVPAKPVRQFQPQIRSQEPVSISVRVEIDQRGIVQDADLLTKQVDGPLGRSAVAAAKRWRFEPAREKDRPVASSMVVKFNFGAEKNN